MKENIREFYIFQERSKSSKTGKWVDIKWFKSFDETAEYSSRRNCFYKTEAELYETRIIHRVTYDEAVE